MTHRDIKIALNVYYIQGYSYLSLWILRDYIGSVSAMRFEAILKVTCQFKRRACRRSHISRAPFAPLGSGAHSAPAWAGWLLANVIRVQLCLWLAAGCGRLQATASFNNNLKNYWRPLSRL